ncbi:MAG: formylglycine-generating enzyme family protein [Bacteroidetes bacterium]|nr:MAG: formylglycine-generating enzyme family protein [Bacteroidota bacterium]
MGKAGTTTDFYSGILTNEYCKPIDANLDRIGWYCGNAEGSTHEVGQKEPNNFGLFDMSGNVWEWCWDSYNLAYYTETAVTDPKCETKRYNSVVRGSHFGYHASDCRSAWRGYARPSTQLGSGGFRVMRTY